MAYTHRIPSYYFPSTGNAEHNFRAGNFQHDHPAASIRGWGPEPTDAPHFLLDEVRKIFFVFLQGFMGIDVISVFWRFQMCEDPEQEKVGFCLWRQLATVEQYNHEIVSHLKCISTL